MRRDRDSSLDGKLDISNHKISGLADPTDADDAVTRRYVASRFQALSDEVQDKKSKLDALQNFLGVVNNRLLIRKYEITGLGFEYVGEYHRDERGRAVDVRFSKYPHGQDDTNTFGFFYIFILKE